MKKKYYVCFTIFVFLLTTQPVFAHPGRLDENGCHTCRTNCTAWGLSTGQYHCHNGESNSSNSGYNNSTNNNYNSNSSVTKNYTYGCTDSKAENYNENADKDDGSCTYKVLGCMDSSAINYNSKATTSDGSCIYEETIEKIEDVKYKTTYEEKDDLELGKEVIKIKGKTGRTKVTYKIIKNEQGKKISQEKIGSEIINKPVNEVIYQGALEETEEMDVTSFCLFLLLIIFNCVCYKKEIGKNTLFSKIRGQKNKLLRYGGYILYYITVFPVWIDTILIVIHWLYNKKKYFHSNKL